MAVSAVATGTDSSAVGYWRSQGGSGRTSITTSTVATPVTLLALIW